uniref:protein-tyrosine-phosphatase n=1 Tax=Cyprinus carpio TaxID=7962 RepID=A0A8C2EK54_CYPCA
LSLSVHPSHGPIGAHDYRIIKNLHITHVVNATAEISDAFPGVLRYLWLRLSDDAQQDLRQALPEASRFIAEALRGAPGGRVLVHCSLGRSRSSVLTLGFLMEHRRWSLLHAFRWLKERRACAAPNAGFLQQLSDYEELLFGHRAINCHYNTNVCRCVSIVLWFHKQTEKVLLKIFYSSALIWKARAAFRIESENLLTLR